MLGEPPVTLHPVVWFGTAMRLVERRCYAPRRTAGVAHAAIGLALGVAGGEVLGSTVAATALAAAGRSLRKAARSVAGELARGELERARTLLPALVGRDPTSLDAAEIARAVVESVAENTVDAVVGPALWGALAGAPAAFGYRAANTMDAMVGHRNPRYERYGWASARLDDAVSYLPARLTAALVMAARPRRWRAILDAVRHQAPFHPSPNAGVAEAAFAAALGLRLGGTNRYGDRSEVRPPLGTGRPAAAGDIAAAIRLSSDVEAALLLGLAALGWRRSVRPRRQRAVRRHAGPWPAHLQPSGSQ